MLRTSLTAQRTLISGIELLQDISTHCDWQIAAARLQSVDKELERGHAASVSLCSVSQSLRDDKDPEDL